MPRRFRAKLKNIDAAGDISALCDASITDDADGNDAFIALATHYLCQTTTYDWPRS